MRSVQCASLHAKTMIIHHHYAIPGECEKENLKGSVRELSRNLWPAIERLIALVIFARSRHTYQPQKRK